MPLAPIVLFVYNRPLHTLQTLEALTANELADVSVLYIYADGPKANAQIETREQIVEVKKIIRQKQWCKEVHIIESPTNKGLADSIIDGVTEIVNKYGKIIVLEDDIVTSPGFLRYMNDALELYKNDSDVMHISGYMYPHKEKLPDTFFLNVSLCWGWATWKRAWHFFNNDAAVLYKQALASGWLGFNKFGGKILQEQLEKNFTGDLRTWFIKWHASVNLKKGFCLFPQLSLVKNIGFDNTGENCYTTDIYDTGSLATHISVKRVELAENSIAAASVIEFYKYIDNIEKLYNMHAGNGYKNWLKINTKKLLKKTGIYPFTRKYILSVIPELQIYIRQKQFNALNIQVLSDSIIGSRTKLYPPYRVMSSAVGNYTYVAENSIINHTTIGKFCSIGPNIICGYGIHPTTGLSTSPMFYSIKKQNGVSLSQKNKISELKPISIGNDVFIGMNVIVLDGVSIGDGAIIGAGAVVSKDIPPYAIAVGNPIKIIRYRFSDEIIENLLKVKWWNWKDEQLDIIEQYFCDVETFIEKMQIPKDLSVIPK